MKFALALTASAAYAVKVDDLVDDLEDATAVQLNAYDMTWEAIYDDDSSSDDLECWTWNWDECWYGEWRHSCEDE